MLQNKLVQGIIWGPNNSIIFPDVILFCRILEPSFPPETLIPSLHQIRPVPLPIKIAAFSKINETRFIFSSDDAESVMLQKTLIQQY